MGQAKWWGSSQGAAELAEDIGNFDHALTARAGLASLLAERGATDEAEAMLLEDAQRAEERGANPVARMTIHVHLGSLYWNLGQSARSVAPFRRMLEYAVACLPEGHPQIAFILDIEPELPQLNLDRQQIKQALINLLDNAVAAIRNQGQIAITIIHDPILKLVRIVVADDGSGITDQDKSRLFEPNFSTKKSGMGLGLTIVNSIITDHNGVIRVQDNQPRGAKFVIELPTA